VNVAVALSGGADSVALLRAAIELKHAAGGKGEFFALHVNHHLRGSESDEDAAWCQRLCESLAIPLEVLNGNVAARAEAEGDGLEAAARNERYRLMTLAAEARGARYLFTAHTADDQVETVLFRLLRGTGLRGLAGMSRRRPLSPALALARPLLDCTRVEIIDYLKGLNQDFRTDSSNSSLDFARNRIRQKLLPLLRNEYSAQVDETFLRLADQARELDEFVTTKARQLLTSTAERILPGEFVIHTTGIADQPTILIAEALRLAWREAGLAEQDMSHAWWTQLAELATSSTKNHVLNLPGNVRGEIRDDLLVVRRVV
jgi:tRNA(Ile)-lysidine synthase